MPYGALIHYTGKVSNELSTIHCCASIPNNFRIEMITHRARLDIFIKIHFTAFCMKTAIRYKYYSMYWNVAYYQHEAFYILRYLRALAVQYTHRT